MVDAVPDPAVAGDQFFVANLLPALLDVPLRRYVISTFLGIIPGALVFTSVGAGWEPCSIRAARPIWA